MLEEYFLHCYCYLMNLQSHLYLYCSLFAVPFGKNELSQHNGVHATFASSGEKKETRQSIPLDLDKEDTLGLTALRIMIDYN